MKNKETLIQFAKVLCVFLVAFLIIITNAEIWNMASSGYTDGFHVVVSILNFVWESVLSVLFFKKYVFTKKVDKE